VAYTPNAALLSVLNGVMKAFSNFIYSLLGKGKLVDKLVCGFDVCARYNGGANAGHTVKAHGRKYVFHLLPCGMLYPSCKNLLGNGVVIHFPSLFDELKQFDTPELKPEGRLFISNRYLSNSLQCYNRAHIVTQAHIEADGVMEKSAGIGTTKRGIGPCYTTKMLRKGLRVGELANWEHFEKRYLFLVKEMKEMFKIPDFDTGKELAEFKETRQFLLDKKVIVDSVVYLNGAMEAGKRILIEGANATMLDIDHGTYPYVTSSSTNIGGACTGLGISPDKISTKVGVVKAYTTRVGGGPFPSELTDKTGEYLQNVGKEFGATTGRKRRCGWLDLNVVRYAHKINNFSSIMITKLDVLDKLPEIRIAVGYKVNGKLETNLMPDTIESLEKMECVYQTMPGWMSDTSKITKFKDLPKNARKYIKYIEESTGIPVSWIGVGPDRDSIILKK